jgi:hypothetical protein
MTHPNGTRGLEAEFDLHGLVGIRLAGATPGDLRAVRRQLGPIEAPLGREPDVTIRFVERLPISSRIRYLGLDEAGFTDDAFLILRSKHKARARVLVPVGRIGGTCEIVCESGLPAVPLLVPILNLTALAKGAVAIHASAFVYSGKGVLTTGWSKGGKTEALLGFMARGAQYIGDEWVYLSADGRRMHGIPEPIRVWDWHLDQFPEYRAVMRKGDLARLRAIRLAGSLAEALPAGAGRRFPPTRLLARLLPLLRQQAFVDVEPATLFRRPVARLASALDKVFFVASHDSPAVTVEPISPEEIAARMVHSLQYERLRFTSYYLMFRFAFPEIRNDLVERAEEIEKERLLRALAGAETYAVHHPYPVPIAALVEAMVPAIGAQG